MFEMSKAPVVGCCLLAALLLLQATPHAQTSQKPLVVYTTRDKALLEPLLQVFTGLTQQRVEATYLPAGPSSRLAEDAAAGKVDLLVSATLRELAEAQRQGLTTAAPISVTEAVNSAWRDAGNHWSALAVSLRVVVASRDRVSQPSFTYAELSEPKWKGKICSSTGSEPGHFDLVAALVARDGPAAAEKWLRGFKANLARGPSGADDDQILAIAAGQCDVALVETSAVGRLRAAADKPAVQLAANAVAVHFPDDAGRGSSVSLSGMALLKNAPNPAGAVLLMQFLLSEPAQFVYAQDGHEYPARTGVQPSGLVESWGKPTIDIRPLSDVAKALPAAADLVRKVDFDKGPAG